MKLCAWVLLLGLPLAAADPHMTAGERARALKYLEESQAEFLAAIEGVTDAQWRWKPAPDRWSVGEVAEHIVTAEGSMWGKIQSALAAPANTQWETQTKGKTGIIVP